MSDFGLGAAMRTFALAFLVTLSLASSQDLVTQSHEKLAENSGEFSIKNVETSSRRNETDLVKSSPGKSTSSETVSPVISADSKSKFLVNSTGSNSTELTIDVTSSESSKANEKREIENRTFNNEFKPFLLFPKLPFLFPGREGESVSPTGGDLVPEKEDEPKPFIFFKYFVNIRQIPIDNGTENLNDSRIVNVKNVALKESPPEDLKNSLTNVGGRRRRNTKSAKESASFFDDVSFFPDSEIDEFFPKPDLFFPDLLFHRKPLRKLSRKKRDNKEPKGMDLTRNRNDFKFFMDLFDEAFAKTKRDLDQANPILEFLRGGADLSRKEDPFADAILNENSEKKAVFNLVNKRDEKPQKGELSLIDLAKSTGDDNPMILVDKIVKIGEMNLPHGDDMEKVKLKRKKKRDAKDSKKRFRRNNNDINDNHHETSSKHLRNGSDNLKRGHLKDGKLIQGSLVTEIKITQSKGPSSEVKIEGNATSAATGNKTSERRPNVTNLIRKVVNSTESVLDFAGDIIKVMDSLEAKLKESKSVDVENLGGKPSEGNSTEKVSYEELERNITKLLTQFMMSFKKLDSVKLRDVNSFDWTENETLQNSNNIFGNKRSKKSSDFTDEYVVKKKKDRQVADLNYLFLTVTLPTIIISALLLLLCFFNIQVRGKICSKLFKPRRVLVIEDETPSVVPVTSLESNHKKYEQVISK